MDISREDISRKNIYIYFNTPRHFEIIPSLVYFLQKKSPSKLFLTPNLLDFRIKYWNNSGDPPNIWIGPKYYLNPVREKILNENLRNHNLYVKIGTPKSIDLNLVVTLDLKNILEFIAYKNDPKWLFIGHQILPEYNDWNNIWYLSPFGKKYLIPSFFPFPIQHSRNLDLTLGQRRPIIFLVKGSINLDGIKRRNYKSLVPILEKFRNNSENIEDHTFFIKILGKGSLPSYLKPFYRQLIVKNNLEDDEFHQEIQECHYILPLADLTFKHEYFKSKLSSSISYGLGFNLKFLAHLKFKKKYPMIDGIFYKGQEDFIKKFGEAIDFNEIDNNDKNRDKIYVSLTTVSPNLPYLQGTISSILKQSVKPDNIIINLPETYKRDFTHMNEKISIKTLKNQILSFSPNIIINSCFDYGPGTKVLGLFDLLEVKIQPGDLIIIIDDDVIYPPKLIENYLKYVKINKKPKIYGICCSMVNSNLTQPILIKNRNHLTTTDIVEGWGSYLLRGEMLDDLVVLKTSLQTMPLFVKYSDDIFISNFLNKYQKFVICTQEINAKKLIVQNFNEEWALHNNPKVENEQKVGGNSIKYQKTLEYFKNNNILHFNVKPKKSNSIEKIPLLECFGLVWEDFSLNKKKNQTLDKTYLYISYSNEQVSGIAEASKRYQNQLVTTGNRVLFIEYNSFYKLSQNEKSFTLFSQFPKITEVILHYIPDSTFPEVIKYVKKHICHNVWGNLVWETNKLHHSWKKYCGSLEGIYVPSKFNYNVFKNSFKSKELKLWPHPFNPKISKNLTQDRFLLRQKWNIPENYFCFYAIENFTERKNLGGLISAYLSAKKDKNSDTNSCLILKISPTNKIQCQNYLYKNHNTNIPNSTTNIIIIDEILSDQEINELHILSDCYLSCSYGEGVGLSILDAITYEKYIICNSYGGHIDYLKFHKKPEKIFLVPYKLVPVTMKYIYYDTKQLWGEIDFKELVKILQNLITLTYRHLCHV